MAQPGLRSNPKFRRLVKRLGLPVPYVMGLLECLWHVGYATANDKIGDAEDVELAAEWPGRRGKFFNAIKKDWLDEREGVYFIHDLDENAPEYVRKRLKRRKDDAKTHETPKTESSTASIDKDLDKEMAATRQLESVSWLPPTQPSPSQPKPASHTQASQRDRPNGVGLNSGVGGVRGPNGAGGNIADDARTLLVQGKLSQLGVNPETQRKLMIRKDVTLQRIDDLVADIGKDPGVGDVAAVLVSRLGRRGVG